MHLITIYFTSSLLMLSATVSSQRNSQHENDKEVIAAIFHHDSLFWEAYNVCDVETMASYFTDDMEFYHDKSGPVYTKAVFIEATKTGLCGNPDFRLRRVALEGTVNVFPLNNYGGLISGEHIFYINQKGKPEYLDGYGKFVQLWRNENGTWKMSRIISYDHGPPPDISKGKAGAKSRK